MLNQSSYFRQARHAITATVRISLITAQMFAALGVTTLVNRSNIAVARSTERISQRALVLAPDAGNITGTVFNDANANGTREGTELGVPGVTVTAFNGGTSVNTTTDANGLYTVTVTGSDTRVEFTGFAGYQSSPVGSNTNTSVRFVVSPASGVNFGIFHPTDFCQNNPNILVSCFVFGDNITGTGQNDRTVLSYPYSASGTNTALQVPEALARQVGSVYGVGYQRTSKFVFVSSYTKRLTGYGPGTGSGTSDGTGTVYMFKAGAPTDAVPFVDLDDLFGAATTGNNPHTGFTLQVGNFDNGAYAAVGKLGLGDIDVSEDDRTLWVVNLANQKLYGVPLALNATLTPVAPTAGQVTSTDIPNPGCANGSARPFAVKPYNGLVYVGGVCDATSGAASDLQAYVYAFNPTSNTWGASPVLQFPLNYPRNCIDVFPSYPNTCKNTTNGSQADWRPWRDTLDTTFPAGFADGFTAHPQPMLSDIEFVPSASGPGGDMVIGFRDRFPDQVGFDDPGPQNNSPRGFLLNALPGGDVLRAGLNAGGTWTIENNSSSNPAGRFGPTTGAGTGEGPGGGEFYWGEELTTIHDETALGALAFSPVFTNIVATSVDPIRAVTAGTIQMNNTDGSQTRDYEIYAPPPAPASANNFRKANGLGDLELLCDAAPIEIGNRVWLDTVTSNGIQDPGELPLANIQVRLTDSLGNSVTATTDANGEYRFSSAVGVNTTNAIYGLNTGTAGSVTLTPFGSYTLTIDLTQPNLAAYSPTTPTADPSANGTARDSNGVTNGTVVNAPVVLGGPGFNNHTYDFGFTNKVINTAALGNYVWVDSNYNGIQDEPAVNGRNGVTVTLFNAADNSVSGTLVTGNDSSGNPGYYTFTNLAAGNYFVCFTLPAGFNFTKPDQVGTEAIDSDANIATGCTTTVTLAAGEVNPNVDAGLYQTAALGNYVWIDTNGDGVQNEPIANGINGVTVTLRNAADNSIAGTQVTINDPSGNPGYYTFTGLLLGSYIVCFTSPAGFNLTLPGQGGNGALDSDANPATGCTTTIVLASGEVNPNIDAGLVQPASLGNYVWLDSNRDGVQNEPLANGRNGVTVTLRRASDNVVIGVLVTANDPTSSNPGYYTFTNLAPGTYTVCFSLPPGIVFTGQDLGGNDVLDSDANPGTGCTASITLASGEVNPTVDAGLFQALPAIVLKKYTNGFDADTPTGPLLIIGSAVTWTYVITNIGNVDLFAITLVDNIQGVITCPLNVLAVGEGMTCTVIGIAQAGQYANTGVVTGTSSFDEQTQVTSTDPSHYFGSNTLPASLGNYVWIDTNGDGVQNEPAANGRNGVTVTLLNAADSSVVNTLVTGNDLSGNPGYYTFTNLAPGNYIVCFGVPPGYTLTMPGQGGNGALDSDAAQFTGCTGTITLAAGEVNPNIDAGLIALASLGNYVWLDANRDGVQNEPAGAGRNGITVTLRRTSDNSVMATLVTANDPTGNPGYYTFTNLAPGSYTVCFAVPAGLVLTNPDQGGNDTLDSDANTGTGCTPSVTLASGDANPTLDAGLFTPVVVPASLGNFVWVDGDRDGQQDAGEPGIAGITVTLRNITGTVIATATTTSSGFYSFTNLVPGSYSVCFVLPPGTVLTGQGSDPNSDTDSNADPLTGCTAVVTLAPGANNPTIDTGVVVTAPAIRITKYTNGFDADLPPGPTVTVGSVVTWTYRITNTGDVTLTTVTLTDDKIGTITCPKTTLVPGEVMTCTRTGIALAGQYVNTAVVTGTNQLAPTQQVTSTNPSHYFAAGPELAISKASSPVSGTPVVSRTLITYTLSVTNTSTTFTATGVLVDDPLPNDTTYVAGSAVPALQSGPTPLVWNVGTLGPGQSASVRFTVRVNDTVADPSGAIRNQAGVRSNEVPRIPSNIIVHPFLPTAVELINFEVKPDGDALRISWTTGGEVDSFGFAIYRSPGADGANKVLVTSELLSAKGGNSTYSVLDATANKANRYYYWLQEVERSGKVVEYTPVSWAPQTSQPMAVNAVGVAIGGGVPMLAQVLQPAAQSNAAFALRVVPANAQSAAAVLAERVVVQPAEANPVSANPEALQAAVVPEANAPAQPAQPAHEAALSAQQQAKAAAPEAVAQASSNETNKTSTRAGLGDLPSYQSKGKAVTEPVAPPAFSPIGLILAGLVGLLLLAVSFAAYRIARRRKSA